MKRAFFLLCLLLTTTISAGAHPFAPPRLNTVAASDTVYLVETTSVKNHQDGALGNLFTFSVIEVLRGKPHAPLTLTGYEGFDSKQDSQWILIHNPSGFKDCVGWALEGDCEWLPIAITRAGDKANAQWLGPLDQVRDYLKQHPAKP